MEFQSGGTSLYLDLSQARSAPAPAPMQSIPAFQSQINDAAQGATAVGAATGAGSGLTVSNDLGQYIDATTANKITAALGSSDPTVAAQLQMELDAWAQHRARGGGNGTAGSQTTTPTAGVQVQGTGAAAAPAAAAGVTAAAVNAATPTGAEPRVDTFELRVMQLVNEIRLENGLQQVSFSSELSNAALGHAQHMAEVMEMAHDGIGDGTAESRVRAVGWKGAWGENVARGQTTAEQVVEEWMASPTHRANILNPDWDRVAVEKVRGDNGQFYWAQNFGNA